MARAKILTIIGELGHHKTVDLIHRRLAKAGFLVFLPPRPSDAAISADIAALDVNILGCIEHSHAVFVIDPDGHQSAATQRHVAFAMEHNKIVFLLSRKSKLDGQIMNTLEMGESITAELLNSDGYGLVPRRRQAPAQFDMSEISKQRSNLLSMRETITNKLADE